MIIECIAGTLALLVISGFVLMALEPMLVDEK